MNESISKDQNGVNKDTVTQPVIDTFDHLPPKYTKPIFDYFHSETNSIINQPL